VTSQFQWPFPPPHRPPTDKRNLLAVSRNFSFNLKALSPAALGFANIYLSSGLVTLTHFTAPASENLFKELIASRPGVSPFAFLESPRSRPPKADMNCRYPRRLLRFAYTAISSVGFSSHFESCSGLLRISFPLLVQSQSTANTTFSWPCWHLLLTYGCLFCCWGFVDLLGYFLQSLFSGGHAGSLVGFLYTLLFFPQFPLAVP